MIGAISPVAATIPPRSTQSPSPSGSEASTADASRSSTETETPAEDPLTSPEVQREIAQLAQRDREVRAHEQAHIAVGGSLITSGPTYQYTTGPDNRRYAVGGEVGIDTSPVRGDPEATIQKAVQIRAAALAPADPSPADRQAAARASQMEQRARIELAEQQRREQAYSATAAAGQTQNGSTIEAIA
ncbi:putative metalloprotease CJM1_0395 family protein [Pseudomarimonas arenosa]|uniref:SprA family protein n=1 Tax=Pseudomarimonas arenosa TaxID=2774145 RepID=A0AAW3ZG15_9GAMM|nr:putative metalloprotease CJM1_0395 family protein [Pseudomarimonas arenosa]MBD8524524.1 hypothetical protein [Pseudomarimonas arenosa]